MLRFKKRKTQHHRVALLMSSIVILFVVLSFSANAYAQGKVFASMLNSIPRQSLEFSFGLTEKTTIAPSKWIVDQAVLKSVGIYHIATVAPGIKNLSNGYLRQLVSEYHPSKGLKDFASSIRSGVSSKIGPANEFSYESLERDLASIIYGKIVLSTRSAGKGSEFVSSSGFNIDLLNYLAVMVSIASTPYYIVSRNIENNVPFDAKKHALALCLSINMIDRLSDPSSDLYDDAVLDISLINEALKGAYINGELGVEPYVFYYSVMNSLLRRTLRQFIYINGYFTEEDKAKMGLLIKGHFAKLKRIIERWGLSLNSRELSLMVDNPMLWLDKKSSESSIKLRLSDLYLNFSDASRY